MPTTTPKTVRPNADRKRRRRLAAMADRAAVPERPFFGHGPRYLIHPSVSVACGPVLSGIARDLRDQAVAIDSEALDRLATFLSGPDSPLFEPSADGALDEAVRLAHIQRRRNTTARVDLPAGGIATVPKLDLHPSA
jgi:hypothetical protein